MNAYAFLIWNRAAATILVACSLLAAGCGGSRLTDDQAKVFTDRVAPELERVLRALEATNASPVEVGPPLRPDNVVCTHASIDGSVWVVRRDGFTATLELRPPAAVSLLSMAVNDAPIQHAVAKLQERLAPAAQIEPASYVRNARQLGDVDDLNEVMANPTNEYRVSANQIRHIAQALGCKSAQGGVMPGTQLGIVLHQVTRPTVLSPAEQEVARKRGRPLAVNWWTEPNSGGYVGLYSASTNLDSVDLVVFVYRGKVQAILQRSGALARKQGPSSASGSP